MFELSNACFLKIWPV